MWDLFISHASEDKNSVVRPLVNYLQKFGIKVWYDEFELRVGDSLSKSIDKGILNSKYGIVILSDSFFSKGWAEYELRSFMMREVEKKDKFILPIWHKINKNSILENCPFLADKYALSTCMGMENLALELLEVIKPKVS